MKAIRYGILGFGRFAERVIAPAIRASPNSSVVAIQKRTLAAAQEKARLLGVPLAFHSVHELVRHPEVDAVFIASANSCHLEETVAAAEAGKHVIVEKPMAMNYAEAEQMIQVCRRKGVQLMVGHMLRLSPLVRRMQELVRSQTLGPIVFARADFVYDGRLSQRSWLRDRKVAGGGPVFDIGVHCIDTLRFILDDEVVGLKSELEPPPTETATEETANLLLRFSRSTIGSITCSFVSPIRQSLIEIVGADGMATARDFTMGDTKLPLVITRSGSRPAGENQSEEIDVPNLYVEEVTQFSRCLLDNTEPGLSGANGLENQRLLDWAMNSG
jgi:1,5-anhydro-D-fructose reductase (1,5-anhydro-D-mannitol-forming)